MIEATGSGCYVNLQLANGSDLVQKSQSGEVGLNTLQQTPSPQLLTRAEFGDQMFHHHNHTLYGNVQSLQDGH